MTRISVLAIICPKCYDQVWSRHTHDMRYCKCGYCYIDGGREYSRIGYGNEWDEQSMYGSPLTECIEVDEPVPHTEQEWPYPGHSKRRK